MALFGRDGELALVRDVLSDDRRCVLVGTGGIGKTALAHGIAAGVRASGEPVTWVDVEPLDSADAVADALARALGVDALPDEAATEVAETAIAAARGLVVLDGVEHVADDLAPMLQAWTPPGASILVTSRVPIGGLLPLVRLSPLSLGDDDPLAGPAGRMLVSLVASQGRRDVSADDLVAAVRATGGLPLAVELAARQIARFGAAFAARHVELAGDDDVIDRSLDRTLDQLDPEVRTVFAALGWTAEAATVELVAGLAGFDRAETAAALGTLVDHGLVFTHDAAFDLLPPVRDRAARLVAGDAALLEVVAWASGAVLGDGRDEPTSYELFDAHGATFDHLAWQAVRAIDAHADTGGAVSAPGRADDLLALATGTARLLNAMYTPLTARMHVRELITLYTRFFSAVDRAGLQLPPDLEAHTARYAAMATSEGSTIPAAERWLDRAETAAGRAQQRDLVLGRIWSIRSILAVDAGDLVRAERLAQRSMEASAVAGEHFFVEQSRRHLAEIALQRGELDEAHRLIEEVWSWAHGNSVHQTYVASTFLGWIAVERGDRARVAAVARHLRAGLGGHADYDAQVAVEADLIWLAADPTRLAATPVWEGDATWWLRLEQRIRRAGALPIDEHWEAVLHTAADVLVLADTVPMMQPRLAAGLLLGDAALAGDDTLQASMAFGQVLRDGIRAGYRLRVADALDGVAVLAGRGGHDVLAGEVAGAAAHLRERCGARPWVRPSLPQRWHDIRRPPARWFVDGQFALAGADEVLRAISSRATVTVDASLTRAERQVALLVADGLSNAEIAATLFVSRRTVESHLARIFRKLGVKNRTQLARLPLRRDG